ncbi:MAG: arsenite methyltransferase, partial [Halanaerobiaceae bacterium]
NTEASFGLGCGNPRAIASLEPGETVLDLGCGAGFDLLLAAKEVGEKGYLIGVDLTPEMIEKARENAAKNNLTNIEFHLADIEDLPLEDNSVDVIMSNCVINLTPDKRAVYQEAFRVLKPGGRLAIADVLKNSEMPEEIKADINNYIECIAGAISKQKLENILAGQNYTEIEIKPKANTDEIVDSWSDELKLSDYIFSAYITAEKPEIKFSLEEYAVLAGALGNAYRVEILKILAGQPEDDRCMVGSLVDQLPISQSTVSQHLKVLKEAGWIIGQTDGPRTCYCLNEETAARFKRLTEKLI